MAVSQQKNLKAPRTSNDRPFRPSPRAALPRFACRPARRGGKPHLALARGMRHERMISPHVSFLMRSAGRLKHKVRAQHRSPKIPLHSPRTLPSSGRPHGAHDHRLCLGRPVTIRGSEGPDSLTGTPGRDVISGRDGDDVVSGMVGRDVLIGGAGADMLTGARLGHVLGRPRPRLPPGTPQHHGSTIEVRRSKGTSRRRDAMLDPIATECSS
jgi:hypothetical protein